MTDLLGDSPATRTLIATATNNFPSETESLGFRNNADYLGVSTLVAQGYVDAAEQFLDAIVSNGNLLGCTPTPTADAEMDCARTFIARFGKLAFRRPLTTDESSQYEALFQKALTAYDFTSAGALYHRLRLPAIAEVLVSRRVWRGAERSRRQTLGL